MSKTYNILNRTKFPDTIDAFVPFKDPNANDNVLLSQYQLYLASGQYAEAAQYLKEHPELSQYIISADRMNQLLYAIIALETKYKDDIEGIMEELKNSLPESFERRGPICSETQPVGQVDGELWFKDSNGAHTIHEMQENGTYEQLYLDAAGIKTSDGQTLKEYVDAQIDDATSTPMAPAAHKHSASDITGGTFSGAVSAKSDNDYSVARLRNIRFGTQDLEAGVSELPSGDIYFVIE